MLKNFLGAAAVALAATPALACTPVAGLPAVLDAPGSYCLAGDLSTAISQGAAITLASDDIHLDCGGLKIEGSAAAAATSATGIATGQHDNVQVWRCTVQGFRTGIVAGTDAAGSDAPVGIVLRSNRVIGNHAGGIVVAARSALVRDNQVLDTGYTSTSTDPVVAIRASGNVDVLSNQVDVLWEPEDVFAPVIGIAVDGSQGGVVADNQVRGLFSRVSRVGIRVSGPGYATLQRNFVAAHFPSPASNDTAFECVGALGVLDGNQAAAFETGNAGCRDAGGNIFTETKAAGPAAAKPGVVR